MRTIICSSCKKEKDINCFTVVSHTIEYIKKKCLDCRVSRRAYQREWKRLHPQAPRVREGHTRPHGYAQRLRVAAVNKLGGCCAHCGITDLRVLQIDHVYGGGTAERKIMSSRWNHLAKVLDDTDNRYQLLCANCNWIKRYTNNETGGRK